MKNVAVILFKDFETLDVFGPVEILGRLKDDFTLRFFSQSGGVTNSTQNVPIVTEALPEMSGSGHVLLIPGGMGVVNLVRDEHFLNDLKFLAKRASYILTVCTGSLLLAKTGLLSGRRATSNKRLFSWVVQESPDVHWVKKARWVRDGQVYTSSGVSAGLDMTLEFVADALGRDIARQQSIEIEYCWKEDARWDPFAEIY